MGFGHDIDTDSPIPGGRIRVGLTDGCLPATPRVVSNGSQKPNDFLELLLDVDKHGNKVVLRAMKATVDLFGWSDHYPSFIPGLQVDENAGVVRLMGPNLKSRRGGFGREFKICRAKTTRGNPAGLTNAFRIRGPVTNRVLGDLAAHTVGHWTWLTAMYGERRSREQWLDIHEVMSGSREERLPPGGEGLAS